jgi:Na+-driven multidrug efflux pump
MIYPLHLKFLTILRGGQFSVITDGQFSVVISSFGPLSLACVVLGYFAIFDLGLGRATTKFVAEALGKGEEDQVPHLVWTAVTIQAFFGLLGAIVLASITPLLVERILLS